MASKAEAKSLKWMRKRDKGLPSKSSSKSIKWASKWQQRQDSFLHNKSINWSSKWARKAAKIARKFGGINQKERIEMRLHSPTRVDEESEV